jgi:hypothetical protein
VHSDGNALRNALRCHRSPYDIARQEKVWYVIAGSRQEMDMRACRLVSLVMPAITAGIMAACVATADRIPLTYRMIDHPDESRIELRYHNDTKHSVCLTSSSWPDDTGNPSQMANRFALVVAGQHFPIRQFNKGPCVVVEYSCVTSVPSGKEITGSIPYDAFGLPASLKDKRKTLDFSPSMPACH